MPTLLDCLRDLLLEAAEMNPMVSHNSLDTEEVAFLLGVPYANAEALLLEASSDPRFVVGESFGQALVWLA